MLPSRGNLTLISCPAPTFTNLANLAGAEVGETYLIKFKS